MGAVIESARAEELQMVVGNPFVPGRPLTLLTDGGELTVCFAHSHYHISDYGQGRTEEELESDIIEGIAEIVSGATIAYSAFAGDHCLGGGLANASTDERFRGEWWRTVTRFEVYSWQGTTNTTVER